MTPKWAWRRPGWFCLAIGIFASGLLDPARAQVAQFAATAPQITVANYELAEARMHHNVFSKVKNVFVLPRWIGETDWFWYPRQVADGIEYTLVDAATGERKAAFDHQRLSQQLAELGATSQPHGLGLSDLQFEVTDGAVWLRRCDQGEKRYERDAEGGAWRAIEQQDTTGLIVSPDGRLGLGARGGNLFLRVLDSGDEVQLTNDGEENFGYGIYYGNWKAAHIPRSRQTGPHPPVGCSWAPDSRHVLALKLDQRHVEPYPLLETVPHDGSYRPKVHLPRIPLTGEEPAHAEWHLLDIKSQTQHKVLLPYEKLFHVHQDMLAIRKIQWSRDCQRVFVVTWGDNLASAQLFDVDAASGAARGIIHEETAPRTDLNSTSYNPSNVHVTADGTEAIWFSQRDGWGHLYLYDAASGALKTQITEGQWLVRDLIHIDDAQRVIYFTASGLERGNPYDRYLYRVNFDGTGMKLLTPEPADHMLTGSGNDVLAIDGAVGYQVVSPSGQYIVYNYSTIRQPTRSAIRRAADGELVAEFEQADVRELYASGWEDPEPFVAKAADGTTPLYGLLWKPANFDEDLKYPVIDSQYASPLTAVVPHNFLMALNGVPELQHSASLAALGFVCVAVDARGTTFRSKEFSHYSFGRLNTIGLEDHVAVIGQLAESRPWMDIGRVGIHGGSYGGFAVFRAMFEFPDFFDVGISGAGVGSIHTMYPDYHWEAYHGRVEYADGSIRRPSPSDRPLNYENNDATIQAKNLKGKLLIMMGELDENVLPGSTLAVIDSLIKLDRDFDMLYVPDRPHNFSSAHVIRRGWDYFVRHLHGVEPPEYSIGSMVSPAERQHRARVGFDPAASDTP